VFGNWALTLREEQVLQVFENRVLKRIFGPNRADVWDSEETCIISNSIIYSSHQIIIKMLRIKHD
jgi:hypothetical protein